MAGYPAIMMGLKQKAPRPVSPGGALLLAWRGRSGRLAAHDLDHALSARHALGAIDPVAVAIEGGGGGHQPELLEELVVGVDLLLDLPRLGRRGDLLAAAAVGVQGGQIGRASCRERV